MDKDDHRQTGIDPLTDRDLTIMRPELIMLVRSFLALQARLLGAFREAYPNVRDWRLLLDCPAAGKLLVDGEAWGFRKHGAGLSFTSSAGVVVDMHRALPDVEAFDAWRLLQYLETMPPQGETAATTEAELEDRLTELLKSGRIRRDGSEGTYRLVQ